MSGKLLWSWEREQLPAKGDSRGYLYRYIDYGVAEFSYWDDEPHGHHMEVACRKFRILKRTPKGAWIYVGDYINQEKKFILLTAYKQFACEGKTLALRSFIARKKRQIGLYLSRVKDAKEALAIAERMKT